MSLVFVASLRPKTSVLVCRICDPFGATKMSNTTTKSDDGTQWNPLTTKNISKVRKNNNNKIYL